MHGILAPTLLVVRDHTAELHGQPVFWRSSAPADGDGDPDDLPTLFVHGVPTSSDDWLPFLRRAPGLAPDLPGFGRSGKRGDGDFTMEGYDRFLEEFLDLVGVERVNLVVHDWGTVGLLWAQRFPERVGRVVVMNAVPLGQDYRWHWIARMWRRRGVGELLVGWMTRWTARPALGPAFQGGVPRAFVDEVFAHFDQGTQRAILRLYRTSPSEKLAAAGADLDTLEGPALVVWGEHDPYIDVSHATAFAVALHGATLRTVPTAGHWVWLDEPAIVDEVCAFVTGAAP